MQFIASHLQDVKNPLDRLYLGLQAFHPFRLEEVLGLMHQDISGNYIHIERAVIHPDRNSPLVKTTKTEASKRVIALVPAIAAMIPEGAPDTFLIGGGTPLSYQRVKRMLIRIKKDIGFDENISPASFPNDCPDRHIRSHQRHQASPGGCWSHHCNHDPEALCQGTRGNNKYRRANCQSLRYKVGDVTRNVTCPNLREPLQIKASSPLKIALM